MQTLIAFVIRHPSIEGLFGKIQALSCAATTHVSTRRDENGDAYACTAEDAIYATFDLEKG